MMLACWTRIHEYAKAMGFKSSDLNCLGLSRGEKGKWVKMDFLLWHLGDKGVLLHIDIGKGKVTIRRILLGPSLWLGDHCMLMNIYSEHSKFMNSMFFIRTWWVQFWWVYIFNYLKWFVLGVNVDKWHSSKCWWCALSWTSLQCSSSIDVSFSYFIHVLLIWLIALDLGQIMFHGFFRKSKKWCLTMFLNI